MDRNSIRSCALWLVALLMWCTPGQARVVVTVPFVPPNFGLQTGDILIEATAGETLAGMWLDVWINDGQSGGPTLTGYDVSSAATLWGQHAVSVSPLLDAPTTNELLVYVYNDTLENSPIGTGANGVLARLTFDMSGMSDYWYHPISVSSVLATQGTMLEGGDWGDVQSVTSFIDGGFVSVPESSTLALAALGLAALVAFGWRRRRR